MRRWGEFCRLAALTLVGVLAACQPAPPPADAPMEAAAPAPAEGTLEWAASGPWRIEPERDIHRHPIETLRFFGVEPNMSVVEVHPGRGWYTAILAPYLARGGGTLYAASFDPAYATPEQSQTLAAFKARFGEDPATFGTVALTALSSTSPGVAPPESVDLVLVFRNIHTLMAAGYAEKAFRDFYKALKPGGFLGVEQHRAKSTDLQDPQAASGYVQEAYVRALAEEAGFVFVSSSEINANPKDTRDHPFGVWTLPPTLRTSPIGAPDNPNFDTTPFIGIGESDRMTMLFRKPGPAPAAKAAP